MASAKRKRRRPRAGEADRERNYRAQLETAKRASPFQLLIRCARRVDERGIARASERFGFPIRTSHTSLFPHIDLDGTRQTELARRLGISKQAVNQLVAELEGVGMLERVADPSDGRATLVRFSKRGRAALLEGLGVLNQLEEELRGALGPQEVDQLHRLLTEVDAWLDDGADEPGT